MTWSTSIKSWLYPADLSDSNGKPALNGWIPGMQLSGQDAQRRQEAPAHGCQKVRVTLNLFWLFKSYINLQCLEFLRPFNNRNWILTHRTFHWMLQTSWYTLQLVRGYGASLYSRPNSSSPLFTCNSTEVKLWNCQFNRIFYHLHDMQGQGHTKSHQLNVPLSSDLLNTKQEVRED